MSTLTTIKVESSNIESIGYVDSGALVVQYKSGAIYKYNNVPKETFDKFVEAESKGRFMNEFIKPNFSYSKIG